MSLHLCVDFLEINGWNIDRRTRREFTEEGWFACVSFIVILHINWMIIKVYILMRYITRNTFKTERYRHDRNDDLYIPDRSTFLRFEDITRRNLERYKNTLRLCVCTCFNRFRFIFIHYIDVSCRSVSYPLKIFPSFESKRSNREPRETVKNGRDTMFIQKSFGGGGIYGCRWLLLVLLVSYKC